MADLAHAVALVEGGGLDAGARRRGCSAGLLELDAIPPDEFPWDPGAWATRSTRARRSSSGASGPTPRAGCRPGARGARRSAWRCAWWRATARSTCTTRCSTRPRRSGRHAAEHADDLAADYTYLQPAQPTTVGHLLLTYAFPLLRDAERLRGVHLALLHSVAGVGGSAGSRWPLDRRRLAELLGCVDIEPHAKDAMWQADVYVELLAAIAMQATHLSQLGQDFEIYASQEFGLVELDDRHSRASALMPQKKNPYALAAIRTQAGQAAGDVTAALTTLHTGSARTDHFHLLNGLVPRALEEAVAVGRLAAAVLDGMQVDVERLGRVAREGFTLDGRRLRRAGDDDRARLPARAQGRGPRGARPARRRRHPCRPHAGAARRRRGGGHRRARWRSTPPRSPTPSTRWPAPTRACRRARRGREEVARLLALVEGAVLGRPQLVGRSAGRRERRRAAGSTTPRARWREGSRERRWSA